MARFEIGNKAAEKWTEEEAKKAFDEMLDYAMENTDVLSVQQAYIDYGMPSTTYYYLEDKFPVLASIKKGINDILISRLNKGCLLGDYVPTPGIWRMKQLGERDEKVIDNKSSDGSMSVSKLSPEAAKAVSNEFDKELGFKKD